ncbi:hypothetical protein QFC21_001869 [Naganishia friedmannii]|uniref:Uncharacterized protein n=1 Tax=Naganishia friedmannii TaxID=89922 RepID=A0ACC2W289_9TREE|nr:hypothetical protein QFC21_001869 [Naganishia friedmannii]
MNTSTRNHTMNKQREGFHSDGARLGGSHAVPEHIGRIKALEAAEKRRVKSTLMGKGGRLGGATGGVARKSPREMAVEAAERRLRDEKSCSHDSPSAVAEAAKAAAQSMGRDAVDLTASDDDDVGDPITGRKISEDGKQGVIDLVSDDSEETSNSDTSLGGKKSRKGIIFPPALADTESKAKIVPAAPSDHAATSAVVERQKQTTTLTVPTPGSSTKGRSGPVDPSHSSTKCATPTSPSATPLRAPEHPYLHLDGSWTCPACTLNNAAGADRCAACDGLKPIDETVGWRCDFCYAFGNEHGRWMCLNCGAIRKHG